MRFQRFSEPCRTTLAFSLVEVVLALGITAFSILTIIGLFGTALNSNSDSEARIRAANLATLVLSQYQNALNAGPSSGAWTSPLPQNVTSDSPPNDFSTPAIGLTVDGQKAGSLDDPDAVCGLRYMVWKSPELSGDCPYELINCALKLQWPAAALAKNAEASGESFEITTSFLVKKQP